MQPNDKKTTARTKLKEKATNSTHAVKTIADTAASPSTSREADEKAANAINNGDDEDYEMNEADTRLTRELYSEIRSIMDQDSMFTRIRSELVEDLERAVRQHNINFNTKSERRDHRRTFEFYELLDDLMGTLTDIDATQLAVLNDTALKLSAYAPLETLKATDELEHALFSTNTADEKIVEESESVSPRKTKKPKLMDGWNNSKNADYEPTASMMATRSNQTLKEEPNGAFADATTNLDANYSKNSAQTTAVGMQLDDKTSITSAARARSTKSSAARRRKAEEIEDKHSSDTDYEKTQDDHKPKREFSKKASGGERSKTRVNGITKSGAKEKAATRRGAVDASADRGARGLDGAEAAKKRRAAAMTGNSTVNDAASTPTGKRRTTRNAAAEVAVADETPAAEQTYCICEQISYGNMICCDNDACAIEWYHFQCVKLSTKPARGKKWFCPSCRSDKSTVLRADLL